MEWSGAECLSGVQCGVEWSGVGCGVQWSEVWSGVERSASVEWSV